MYQTDKTKWSYLAGILDGKGTICLHEIKNDKDWQHFGLQVIIYGTSVRLMKWLVACFGGVYYVRSKTKLSVKTQYAWHPSGKANREQLLLGVLPYMVIKREQAKLALEFIRLGDNVKDPEARKKLVEQCRSLNKSEPSVETDTPSGSPELMIQSELTSDCESDPVRTQGSEELDAFRNCTECGGGIEGSIEHMPDCPRVVDSPTAFTQHTTDLILSSRLKS
jgi:hypothetical protein